MGKKFLLDTNVVIDFCSLLLPDKGHKIIAEIIDENPLISVINKIELLSLNEVPQSINTFIEAAHVIHIDDNIVSTTILLRRKHKMKLPDAIIAASAIAGRYTIITHNVRDFSNIRGLTVLDPYD